MFSPPIIDLLTGHRFSTILILAANGVLKGGDTVSDFLNNKVNVLALLYLRQQNLSSLSPVEFYDKFEEVKSAMKKRDANKHPTKVKTFE